MVHYMGLYMTDWNNIVLDRLKPYSFIIALSLALLFVCVDIFMGFKSSFKLSQPVKVDKPIVQPPAKPLGQVVGVASTTHLFGEYIPDDVDASGVKQSGLNLNIVGILFSEKEADSRVMFELPGKLVKTYGLGDTLPGGAVIKRIADDGILITRSGVVERLTLPKDELFMAPVPQEIAFNDQ